MPRNDPHLLTRAPMAAPIDASEVVMGYRRRRSSRRAAATVPDTTEVWCGFLGTDKSNAHPLLSVTACRCSRSTSRKAEEEWVDALDALRRTAGASRPRSSAKLGRVVRRPGDPRICPKTYRQDERGWLAGLRDPAVGAGVGGYPPALCRRPGRRTLAREAGVSRTVLGERFVELLDEPPMRYCARWRMRAAANHAARRASTTAPMSRYAVGFNSEAAFNRAFKRRIWRAARGVAQARRGRAPGRGGADQRTAAAAAKGPLCRRPRRNPPGLVGGRP